MMLPNHMQNNKTEQFSYTTQKVKSKWVEDLHIRPERPEAIKFLDENIGNKFLAMGLGNDLFGYDT